MENADDTNRRLTDLEIKASFTEDLLEQLDRIIVRQQQQIDNLIRETGYLRQSSAEGGASLPRNPREELPPHF
jgi:SlyX protein